MTPLIKLHTNYEVDNIKEKLKKLFVSKILISRRGELNTYISGMRSTGLKH
jgi:hypothetical protein